METNRERIVTIMGSNVIPLQEPNYEENISPWLATQLILAFSEDDDVLERTHTPEELLHLEMCIADNLTNLRLIEKGIVL
jgi:Trp operon repressor